DQGAKIAKSWDQGLLQWASWAIPKGAANVENAQKYIAYISRPQPQAKFSELITYGPTNSRAFAHISAERAALLPTA
ncbi:extracellular solute-binding protein, partial [Raoultella planticola]|uniref:extracellular solute-binding protein n=1 Tax=Raoultella planticola TaxID=575 RepID=UPI0013D597FE